MNAFQEFSLIVTGHVTAISLAVIAMIALSKSNPARRHSVGVIGLLLVLCSPFLVGMLPPSGWWRVASSTAFNTILQADTSSSQASSKFDSREAVASNFKPELPVASGTSKSRPTITETSFSNPGTLAGSTEISDGFANSGPVTTWLNVVFALGAVVWGTGSIVSFSRWLWQNWQIRSILRSLSICPDAETQICDAISHRVCRAVHLHRLPQVSASDLVPMAMVLGLWRPRIVVPLELLNGDADRLRDVLIHESAHIVRRDAWVNAAQRLALVLWWWHPGVLWLNRLIARSREEVCDNFVLQQGDAASYAQTLLELTEMCASRGRFAPALGLLGSPWTLEERIAELLKPERKTMTRTKLRTLVATATVLGMMCLLVGGVRAVDEPKTKSNTQKPSGIAAIQTNEVQKSKPGMKSISGRVVDDQDRPVAGAQLWWVVSDGVPDDVVVKKLSDGQGRFSMSTPDVPPEKMTSISDALWVLKEGKQLATISAGSLRPRDAKTPELVVRLEPEADTSFVVQSPDLELVADAAVEPWHFRNHQGYAILPPEIRKILTGTTDAEGRVRMPSMPRKGFHTVRTISKDYGTQELRLESVLPTEAERMIELRPVGSIEGRLTSADPKWVRGVQLWFSSETQSFGNGWKTEGFATATSDEQGRFVVPAIAQGKLRIEALVPKDAPVLPRLPDSSVINAGVTEELEITLETPVVVRGKIRTEDTDKPVPGVEISVRYGVWRQGAMVTSDANGEYEAQVLAGPVYVQVIARPQEFGDYEQTGTPWNEKIEVSDPTVPFELPTIQLSPTVIVKGKLIDQDGKPLAKKRVSGIFEGRRYGFSISSEKGEFEMQIPKNITIQTYQVWLNDAQFVTPDVEESESLVLRAEVPR